MAFHSIRPFLLPRIYRDFLPLTVFFGEDDRPVSDDEMVEFAECLIARGADPDQKLTEFVESKKNTTKN
jgi:hypothetical protein